MAPPLDRAARGVTRPMAEQQHRTDEQSSGHDDTAEMLTSHHEHTLWVYWAIVLLGLWLLAAPKVMSLLDQPRRVFGAMFWGFSVPWSLLLALVVGVWFMFQPALLGHSGGDAGTIAQLGATRVSTAHVFHLGGALIVVVSAIAMGEVIRATRYFNLLPALGIAVLPWFSAGQVLDALLGTVGGLAALFLSLPRGVVREHYGSWQRHVV